jgi:dTMP kinase
MSLTRFFVFEGLDGSGTTTQLNAVSTALHNTGNSCFTTQEPTRGPIGSLLREYLSGRYQSTESTLAYLFSADRNEHIYGSDGIIAHLALGEIVISDRYFFSSMAYQQIKDKTELTFLLNQFPLPEALIYFDIDPEIAYKRICSSRVDFEIYEILALQKKIAKRYEALLSLYETSEMAIYTIDASLPEKDVTEQITACINRHIGGSR